MFIPSRQGGRVGCSACHLTALTAAPGFGLFCALVLIGAVAALSFRDETGPDLPLSRGLGAAVSDCCSAAACFWKLGIREGRLLR